MIYLKDIRQYVDRMLKKEQRGGVFSGDDFNRILSMANAEHYDAEKRKAEATQDMTDSLKGYITTVTGSTGNTVPTMGQYTIPANYGKILSAKRLYNGSYRKADVVTQLEYEERLNNSLTEPSDKNPVVKVEATKFVFDPNDFSTVSITYLKRPAEPYLDFYWDANDEEQYLDEDESYALQSGEVYRDGTDSGTVTSDTVELDWELDSDKVAIVNRVLMKMGLPIPNPTAMELGMAEISKSDAKV